MQPKRFLDPAKALSPPPTTRKPLGRRAALYTRVSDDTQEKQCSVETQITALKDYCRREGIAVYDVYRDEDVRSEIPLPLRPDGHRLIEDAKAGQFDLVLIYLTCRWSRYPEVYHAGRNILLKLGVDLDCPGERLSWDTPGEAFASDVRLRTNQLYRDILLKQTTDGRYTWSEKGAFVGGPEHYGYIKVPAPELGDKRSKYAIDPDEAPVVQRIFHLSVIENMSCPRIARLLNSEGVPVPALAPKHQHSQHPRIKNCRGVWSPQRVAQILHDRLFTGECLYGGTRTRPSVLRKAPALIDIETWEAAQLRLTENKRSSPRNAKRLYLFRGKLYCATCGVAYSGVTDRNDRAYYQCGGYIKHLRGLQDHPCPYPRLPAAHWEADLWTAITDWLQDPAASLERIRALWGSEKDDLEGLRRQRDKLLKERTALTEEETLALRGKSRIDMDLTREQAEAIVTRIAIEREQITARLAQLDQQIERGTERQDRLTTAEGLLERLRSQLRPDMSPEKQKPVIDGILIRAQVEKGEAGYELAYYFVTDQPAEAGWKGGERRTIDITCSRDVNSSTVWRCARRLC